MSFYYICFTVYSNKAIVNIAIYKLKNNLISFKLQIVFISFYLNLRLYFNTTLGDKNEVIHQSTTRI